MSDNTASSAPTDFNASELEALMQAVAGRVGGAEAIALALAAIGSKDLSAAAAALQMLEAAAGAQMVDEAGGAGDSTGGAADSGGSNQNESVDLPEGAELNAFIETLKAEGLEKAIEEYAASKGEEPEEMLEQAEAIDERVGRAAAAKVRDEEGKPQGSRNIPEDGKVPTDVLEPKAQAAEREQAQVAQR